MRLAEKLRILAAFTAGVSLATIAGELPPLAHIAFLLIVIIVSAVAVLYSVGVMNEVLARG